MKNLALVIIAILCGTQHAISQSAFVRVNQAGYLSGDVKVATALSNYKLAGRFTVRNASGKAALTGQITNFASTDLGGPFAYNYRLDLTRLRLPGTYTIELPGGTTSAAFTIGPYPRFQEDLLFFMRQQRCGFNPYLNKTCHVGDGRSVYAPFADGTFVDAVGGWHDAGDQLKYLITASNATARMMLAYELEPAKFSDQVDGLGRERPNGIPDILDEAYWGLVWIHKLHPAAGLLIHQVADDRDHRGFKLPDQDNADYGWGPNSYRPAYFADGKPQGLGKWKSRSTGVANVAGRSAAAMAMAYRIWQKDLKNTGFAEKCLNAARDL